MEKLHKIAVSQGIYWVEAPLADLRILCGCPADSVKHLIKRGLILQKEKQGVPCESGPNAILLSDTMLQNGDFANLSEFPVLQMLYKQGMILPGHPNNTGAKPLLIGLPQQVNAQLQYIYRGNYGLVSLEELMQAGLSREAAQEQMRLKLRFAFGRIRPSQELLDTCLVEQTEVEIRNGLFIRRTATNHYVFRFQEEEVAVDLNLSPREQYETPYPLVHQRLVRDYFSIIHSGEGDGWDVNRPAMSSILVFQGRIFLVDAGPNLAQNLTALGVGLDEVEGIFHTHAHDDHFAGITTLMQAGHRIRYFATPLVRASTEKKIAALLSMEEERFRDFFDICDLTFDVWNDIEGVEVKPIFSPHPVETSIFLFRTLWANGYKTYAHFADIVPLDLLRGMITADTSVPGVSREFYNRVEEAYLTPADLKKIDIGGGLIHGQAKDFRQDASGKILLAHVARPLTSEEKEIGSSAPYGTSDILIVGKSDFTRRGAFEHLRIYFPDMPVHQVRILLNNDLEEFNPGSIILREGTRAGNVLLILGGVVERIISRDNVQSRLSAGALIGEKSCLHHQISPATYRAASYVQVLRIPGRLYLELVRLNGLLPKIEALWEKWSFFQTTTLFGEGVSYPVLSQILDRARVKRFRPGERITCQDLTSLNLVRSGRLRRLVGSEFLDMLERGAYFGEEGALFSLPCLFRLEVEEETEVYQVDGELLKDIPVIRWKLFESYTRRTLQIVHAGNDREVLRWREEFSVHVLRMDTQHKTLVEIANGIIEMQRAGEMPPLERAFQALMDYTRYHFAEEEALMALYGYPGLAVHREHHRRLVERVVGYWAVLKGGGVAKEDFRSFFTDWLVHHILEEDRQYAAFLNNKCIY
ncbi:MAG: bacteriohemerythrin [Magnetococcales bacterium]|nr:bacteriohemerythrin [Magnetococcales bacterium]